MGTLSVIQVKKNMPSEDPNLVIGESAPSFTKIELDMSSYFYVGGVPEGFKVELSYTELGTVFVRESHSFEQKSFIVCF